MDLGCRCTREAVRVSPSSTPEDPNRTGRSWCARTGVHSRSRPATIFLAASMANHARPLGIRYQIESVQSLNCGTNHGVINPLLFIHDPRLCPVMHLIPGDHARKQGQPAVLDVSATGTRPLSGKPFCHILLPMTNGHPRLCARSKRPTFSR